MLPFNPKTSETAGRTMNMVDEPVIPNTVQISAISAYHFRVFRGGIGFGARKRWRKVVVAFVLAAVAAAAAAVEEEVDVVGGGGVVVGLAAAEVVVVDDDDVAFAFVPLLLLLPLPPLLLDHRRQHASYSFALFRCRLGVLPFVVDRQYASCE